MSRSVITPGNDDVSWADGAPSAAPEIGRRQMLAAGAGAAFMLSPALTRGSQVRQRAEARPGHEHKDCRRWGRPGLHGATLDLNAYPAGCSLSQAISVWEADTGCRLQATKVYKPPGKFPTIISPLIATLIEREIKALLCFKPTWYPLSRTELAALENTLRLYSRAGLKAEVTLWQEPQVCPDRPSSSDYVAMVRHYGPMVRQYYPLAYDASGHATLDGWRAYYPGDDYVDTVAVDYYGWQFVTGERLDVIAGLADNARPAKPFGIWEMGNMALPDPDPTPAQVTAYFAYIQSFMADRLAAGKANGELCWYNGNGANTIRSPWDYRARLWQSLTYATAF